MALRDQQLPYSQQRRALLQESRDYGDISVVKRSTEQNEERARMVHIRLGADLHRSLRLIAAEQDTTLQALISRTLEDAVMNASQRSASSEVLG